MNTKNQIKSLTVGLGVLGLAVNSANCQDVGPDTLEQTGTSGTTYTGSDIGVGSGNNLRKINYATIDNDAINLYITLAVNPAGNLETGGAFNYIMLINGPNGDAVGSSDNGNPYSRNISIDNTGALWTGATGFVGLFGAGASGANGSSGNPYTSYGFNDYTYSAGAWTKVETVSSGEPISDQPSTSVPNQVTVTVPLSDLGLTPGETFDFDIMSTGTSSGQTAYGSLANPNATQTGTYSSTAQYIAYDLDSYTVAAVPEPSTLALGLTGLSMILFRHRRK